MSEYQKLDALAMAELVTSGETTPEELLCAALSMVEKTQESLNAIASCDEKLGEEKAQKSDKGIFRGVPFLVKELLPYPGLTTAMGSRLFAMNVPAAGSEYTDRIDGSGLVTFGNTTSSEFGLLGSTETLLHGTTRNPWHPAFSAAGSSGGSAAAVAAGIVPMAHASDGGGSIRVPASACGLFGFKPSAGRCVPASEISGPFANLVTEHCITKSVRDSAAFLSVTEDSGTQVRRPAFPPIGFIKEGKKQRLRIGVYTKSMMGRDADPQVARAIEKTQALCTEIGHDVIPIAGPKLDGAAISAAFFTIAGLMLDQMTQFIEPMLKRQVSNEDLEPFTYELIEWYRGLDASAVQNALAAIQEATSRMLEFAKDYDVLLCPTLTTEPQKLGYLSPSLHRDDLIKRTEDYVGYTPIHNMSGMCAMSVPMFVSESGLPIGSHFAAMPGADEKLLQLAYQLEEAEPWIGRLPRDR